MPFHDSIRPPKGMSHRATVLGLLRAAAFNDDRATWLRLYVENPISRTTAENAWRVGRALGRLHRQRERQERERAELQG